MQWKTIHTRTAMKLTAHGRNGRRYEVVSAGIPKPVHTYSLNPDQKTPAGKVPRRRIATTPNIGLGILSAEQVERWERNGDLHHADPNIVSAEHEQRHREATGQHAIYTLSAPISQMMVTQDALQDLGIGSQLDFQQLGPRPEISRTIPLPSLRNAIEAVNDDLTAWDLQPRMKPPPMTELYPQGNLVAFLQHNFRWSERITIVERRWQTRGQQWGDVAAEYPQLFEQS